jgi:hypothetical protein
VHCELGSALADAQDEAALAGDRDHVFGLAAERREEGQLGLNRAVVDLGSFGEQQPAVGLVE